MLRLENNSSQSVGYNLCFSALGRRVEDQWESAQAQSDTDCTAELRLLKPEESASFEFTLAAGLPAGTYRFSTSVEQMDGRNRKVVATSPFTIESN